MTELGDTAAAFIEMAHRIVWATVATSDPRGRSRSRILHPIWEWDGLALRGWIGTTPTATKRSHLAHSEYVSVSYWEPSHDTCVAECRARWAFDDATRVRVWELFKAAPAPVGYDPALIPTWHGPTTDSFAAIALEPWRLRVFPGTVLMGQGGAIRTWREPPPSTTRP